MKKFTLLAVVALLSTTMFAQKAPKSQKSVRAALTEKRISRSASSRFTPPESKMRIADFSTERLQKAASMKPNRVKRAGEAGGVITEAPGTEKIYTVNSHAYYVFWGMVFESEEECLVGKVVFGDDNTVYIKNPISLLSSGSYMKGTIDGDKITVTLPQPIYEEYDEYYDETYSYDVDRLVFDEEENWYFPDTEQHELTFTLRNDSLLFDETDGDVILGLTYKDEESGETEWMGYGNFDMVYAPCTYEQAEVPATITPEDWILINGNAGQNVQVAFDGNDVYVGGLCDFMPDAWIKGTRDGSKVTFATNQYLGPDEDYGYHTFFLSATIGTVWDEYYEDYVDSYIATDNIEFTYDEENKTLSTDSVLLVNAGNTSVYYMQAIEAPFIKYFDPSGSVSKPQAPVFTYFMDYDDYYGYGCISFDLPMFDVDGNFLDVSKMHYNLFIDDESDMLTLYTDEYVEIPEEMTDIPYTFTDDYDILYNKGAAHTVYYFFTGAEFIGVQSTYTPDEGEPLKSDIAWFDVIAAGIDNAKADTSAEIKKVAYTDLAGRELSAPAKGINIKTVTYSDGSVKSFKVVKR